MTLPILLVLAALILLVLEVLVVSLGAIAILAAGCAITGIVLAFEQSSAYGWTMIGVTLVGAPLALAGAFRLLPKLPFGRAFYLKPPATADADRRAGATAPASLVGQEGRTLTPLRPSGIALIADQRRDVVSDGRAVPVDTPVRVVEVSGNRIVVEAVASGPAS